MTIVVLGLMMVAVLFGTGLAWRKPADFLIFLLCVGTLRFGADVADVVSGTNDLSSIWLLCLILLSVLAILRAGALRSRLSWPEWAYLLFLGWCLLEAFRAESWLFASRMFLKLSFPFLVMVLARSAIRTPEAAVRVLKCMLVGATISYLLLGGVTERVAWAFLWSIWPFFWTAAAYADHAAIMTIVALAAWRLFRQRRYFVLAMGLGTSSILAVTRTGIVAAAVGVALFCLLTFGKRSIPLLFGVYAAAAASLFVVPEIREKMFFDSKNVDTARFIIRPDLISLENTRDNGRLALWRAVLERFFTSDPMCGSGLGATQSWFFSDPMAMRIAGVKVEHSEYVRLLCDTGSVGLGIYMCSVIVALTTVEMRCRQTRDNRIRVYGVMASCAFACVLVCMAFDNILNYVLPAGQYPWAFVGVAFGATQKQRDSQSTFRQTAQDRRCPKALRNPLSAVS